MGLYRSCLFPAIIDRFMADESFGAVRGNLLSGARGRVLEIGFGTGLNLQFYPAATRRVVGLDPNPGMHRRALKAVWSATAAVDRVAADAVRMPFVNRAFDTVVSTWTLCSIDRVAEALAETRRVLAPGGRFLFAEHGRSPDPRVGRWQKRLTPIQRRIADGCHLDRDIRRLVEEAGFAIDAIDNFYMERMPRIGGYLYVGVATAGATSRADPAPDAMIR